MRAVLVAVFLLAACSGDDLRGNVTIVAVAAPQWEPALRELVSLTPYPGLAVTSDARDGIQVIVVDDPAIPLEGYQLSRDGDTLSVQAHDVLGAQYGVTAALEALGFRFRPRRKHCSPMPARSSGAAMAISTTPSAGVTSRSRRTRPSINSATCSSRTTSVTGSAS